MKVTPIHLDPKTVKDRINWHAVYADLRRLETLRRLNVLYARKHLARPFSAKLPYGGSPLEWVPKSQLTQLYALIAYARGKCHIKTFRDVRGNIVEGSMGFMYKYIEPALEIYWDYAREDVMKKSMKKAEQTQTVETAASI